jgi:hypothetical protein
MLDANRSIATDEEGKNVRSAGTVQDCKSSKIELSLKRGVKAMQL